MRSNIRWGLCLFLLSMARFACAAVTPLEVYGRLPSIEDVALSPDGSRLALVKTEGDKRVIYVLSIGSSKLLKAFRTGDQKLRGITWGDNDHLLVTTSTADHMMYTVGARGESFLLQVCDVVTGGCVNPIRTDLNAKDDALNIMGGEPELRRVDGDVCAFVIGYVAKDSYFLPALFRYNLSKKSTQVVAQGTQFFTRWLINKEGEVTARNEYNETERRWQLSLRIDGKMKTVMAMATQIDAPSVSGFSPNGDSIWLHLFENDSSVIKSISLMDGAVTSLSADMSYYDGLLTEDYSGRIIGGYLRNADDIDFLDSHMRETWRVIVNRFPNERVQLVSNTPDFAKVVVRVEGKQDNFIYVLFDTDTYEFQSIGNVYEGLNVIAETRALVYPAADGFEVPGFVTLPPNRAAKNLPLVVLPHGGPQARDTGHFDWLAQALAAQGYVVLQANIRGSDLGWRHVAAGFGEWGGKMQIDLSDGVRYLVKTGLVDAQRVCIVGASYGGYAALAGATLDTGVYRCAVSIAGIADLPKFQDLISLKRGQSDNIGGRYLDRYLGAANRNDPILKARSPVQHAAEVSIPILLIHGRDDTVVPFEQSQVMADALKRAGKPFELIPLKNEDHWLSRSATRLQALQETVRFLRQHNPPD